MKMRNESQCMKCSKDPIIFSSLNDMDPGDVPQVLKDLNDTEEQLIGRVKVVIRTVILVALSTFC